MSKPAAGGAAGSMKVSGDDDRTPTSDSEYFSRNPFKRDVLNFQRFEKFIMEEETTGNRTVVNFLQNKDGDYGFPTKAVIPQPRQPADLIIPEGADAETTYSMTQENLKELTMYEDKIRDNFKIEEAQKVNFHKLKMEWESNQERSWVWLRRYVNATTISSITRTLKTSNAQDVFAELLRFDKDARKLAEDLEHTKLYDRLYAFYFNPRTTISSAFILFLDKLEQLRVEAGVSEEEVQRRLNLPHG